MIDRTADLVKKSSTEARSRGFTLIELIIVVAIVAILAAIAVASYEFAIVKTRRGDAASCLLEEAQRMERFYTTSLRYDTAPASAGGCVAEAADHYTIGILAQGRSTFTLQAVPQGRQAVADTRCGTLTINQVGTKTESGTASDPNDCL